MKRFFFKSKGVDCAAPQARNDLQKFLSDVDAKARLRPNHDEFRTVRLLARSGGSKAAKAVWGNLEEMKARGVRVVAVFTPFKSKKDETGTVGRYAAVFGEDAARKNVRIVRLKKAKQLSEQAQFGETSVWNEELDKNPNGPLKVNDVAAGDLTLSAAKVSFEMVWAIADELPTKAVTTKRK